MMRTAVYLRMRPVCCLCGRHLAGNDGDRPLPCGVCVLCGHLICLEAGALDGDAENGPWDDWLDMGGEG